MSVAVWIAVSTFFHTNIFYEMHYIIYIRPGEIFTRCMIGHDI